MDDDTIKFLIFLLFFFHSSSHLLPPLDALAAIAKVAPTTGRERGREVAREMSPVTGGRGANSRVGPMAGWRLGVTTSDRICNLSRVPPVATPA